MNVLRTAIPLVEGLLSVFFEARVVIISAFRSEAPPFPVQIDYVRIHKIEPEDTLIELTSVRILIVGVTPALARDLVHTRVFFEDIQTFATLEQALRAVIAHTRES